MTISDVAVQISNSVVLAGSTMNIGLYNSAIDPVTNTVYPANLIANFGAVSVTSIGTKTITAVGLTLPATIDNLYWWALLRTNGSAAANPIVAGSNALDTFGPFATLPATGVPVKIYAALRSAASTIVAFPNPITTTNLNSYVQFISGAAPTTIPQVFYRQ